jgi:glycosidase
MSDTFTTPNWVKHAVFYQIFPERFANGDPARSPENVLPWGTLPTAKSFMGGDLRGIITHLDYLADLGVTALYLNPIFHATSNHKFDTYDYFRIDPHFGDMATFHELIDQAHQRGIRVILDAVLNHCGRGFFAFHDILENDAASPYLNWFHITKLPLHPYDMTKPANYAGWWNLRSLPKFNTEHPPVRRFLLDVARYWIEQGADGWRLDVPNEIDDHDFWREFRHVVKTANPEAYIVGEIWEDASIWLDGTQFDAVMNYPWRDLCHDFFAHERLDAVHFGQGLAQLFQRHQREITLAQLNLLGSHDTARFITEAGGDVSRFYPAVLFQMTFPGAPCIYYGDEIGMEGAKDPGSRACFPWDTAQWNHELHAWVKHCIALRRDHPALRTGRFRTLPVANNRSVFAFARWDAHERLIILLNPKAQPATLDLPLNDGDAGAGPFADGVTLTDQLGAQSYTIQNGVVAQVHVPGRRGVVLHVAHQDEM